MKFHKIADLFPLIEGDEFQLLCVDIEKEGLNHSIVLLENAILDGRNRYRACLEVGVEPIFEEFKGNDPLAFVLSENLHRRHLTVSQRAAMAAEIANMTQSDAGKQYGRGKDSSRNSAEAISNTKASDLFQVGQRYVEEAKAIKRNAPEKFEELKKGEKTIQQIKKELAPPSQPEFDENIKTEYECPKCGYEW